MTPCWAASLRRNWRRGSAMSPTPPELEVWWWRPAVAEEMELLWWPNMKLEREVAALRGEAGRDAAAHETAEEQLCVQLSEAETERRPLLQAQQQWRRTASSPLSIEPRPSRKMSTLAVNRAQTQP
ncbi:hypothetical protein GQ55_1G161100 [Panicum hallii var. hallii]|uniref:Uncharacterized protein n=1 Tax=Panicum hallii var. hallii TaxID=1504633 RepID=A0A2T7F5M1_9POAL|nr:hypothetical protein GQ55_1G161100 [Panicum hallii var. hallii]